MLTQFEDAWAVYAAFFLFFTVILICRCRSNIYLVPFVIFGMLVSIADICLIASHAGTPDEVLSAQTSAQTSFSMDRYWISKSLVLSVLPAISLLIFIGIMESQLIFIRHISIAIQTRDRWGLRDPEKRLLEQKKSSERPRTYWLSLVSLALYTILAFSSLIIILVATSTTKDIGVAVCVSLMFVVVCINTAMIISFTRHTYTNHARLIRRNRGDIFFLRTTPVLFSICVGGMMILSCLYASKVAISTVPWIVLQSFLVYLPLLGILMLCVYSGKFKKMGRQYRVEDDQKSYNSRTFSYRVMEDIENITKKISEAEAAKVAYPPLPAYQPPQH